MTFVTKVNKDWYIEHYSSYYPAHVHGLLPRDREKSIQRRCRRPRGGSTARLIPPKESRDVSRVIRPAPFRSIHREKLKLRNSACALTRATDSARNRSQLYLFSEYFAPAPEQPDLRDHFPEARFWNRMVVRDSRIRVKIGNRVFKMRAYPIRDENETAAARPAFFSKYPDVGKQEALPESQRPRLHFFHLELGWNDRT